MKMPRDSLRFFCVFFCSSTQISYLLRFRSGVAMVFAGIGYEVRGKYRRHNEINVEKKRDTPKQQLVVCPV